MIVKLNSKFKFTCYNFIITKSIKSVNTKFNRSFTLHNLHDINHACSNHQLKHRQTATCIWYASQSQRVRVTLRVYLRILGLRVSEARSDNLATLGTHSEGRSMYYTTCTSNNHLKFLNRSGYDIICIK